MVYLDTSALVPIFIREPGSDAVIGWLESSRERLAISDWSIVEFASAAAIKVRTGQIESALARQATRRFEEFAGRHCAVAIPGRDEYRRAAELAGNERLKLRAGDALHLAIAEALRVQALLCLDDAMSECARALEMRVEKI